MIMTDLVTMCGQSVYSIADYIPYATHYISMTYFMTGTRLLNPFYLFIFRPFPHTPHPLAKHQFVPSYKSVSVLFCLIVCFAF